MPNDKETISKNFESSIENLNIQDWSKIQMTNTLKILNGMSGNQAAFYSIEGDKVKYNMDTVKNYLIHICKKEDGTIKTDKEMTDDIRKENINSGNNGGATSAWITAVQIALEYLGYDVGKIDGILGLGTKTAVQKYQRYNNLGVDKKPGPKTIEKLIKDIENFEKNKKELQYVEETIKGNEKKYNFEGCINFINGYLVFADKFINKLKNLYKKGNDRDPLPEDILISIKKILEKVLKPGEHWGIEYRINNRQIRKVFSYESRKFEVRNLLEYDVKDIKLIPNFMMGYESYFLGGGTILDGLRRLGITMEECAPIINEYLKTTNKNNLNEINGKTFFNEKINLEMAKYLFGKDGEIQKKLLPMDIQTGLKFYKMKLMRGEINFKDGILSLINAGMMNENMNETIENIIKLKLKYNDLRKYIELYKYLDKKGLEIDYNVLKKYSINKYLKVLKEMDRNNIPYYKYLSFQNDMVDYIESFDFCMNNNIPLDTLNYFGNDYVYLSATLQVDLFKDITGKELYLFLQEYPQQLNNLGGKIINQIELNAKRGGYNFCFRGIVEMIKSRDDINIPILPENPTETEKTEWKKSWEKIIKEYENLLRNYISLDKDENGKEKPINETFDKIFFANAAAHDVEDGKNGVAQGDHNIKDILENFTKSFEDCSSTVDKYGKINQKNQREMIEKIGKYSEEHPNEKILVYLGYHGDENGNSSNGWRKQDRINLSNISENIKIMSTRCYFGRAYSNDQEKIDNIYSIQSPVTGYSNNSPTNKVITDYIRAGHSKGLGFHEMEIYTRLNYNVSFSPLTEFLDYIDINTGEKKHGKIGLADASTVEQDSKIV